MHVLTGPAGSGKTAAVLEAFRAALRARDDAVRLLVPTATLAEHLQHRLAREGFVFRRSLVQTLHGFVESRTRDLREAPETVLYLIVEEAARRVNRAEFARVVDLPGFCASVSRTLLELSSAGCDSARLASSLPDAPLATAFLEVYHEVDRELERRGLVLRARRLAIAAERIEHDGAGSVSTVWLDGFHALPDPELRVIGALARHANVTLTIGESEFDDRVRALAGRIERRPASRPSPAVAIVRAPNIERECDEIARRILLQAGAGRPFREMGVIVRAGDTYAPILRSTLERFGIPARFYFDEELERHPAARHVMGAVDAMLGGWDHAATLAALRVAPEFEDSNALDLFDFKLREQIPNAGLDALRALTADTRLLGLIDRLAALEEWRGLALEPRDWAARVNEWAGAPLLTQALDEAAEALEGRGSIGPAEYWRAAKSVIRLTPLRVPDQRRNVVNVLSGPEARQWVLPVVFVCGMVEKQFPQFHPQEPFFPDAARRSLNASGIRVRTAEQFEREERGLFESAVTRATLSVVLSYPEFDARGERNLPSLYLESFAIPAEASRAVRPAPRRTPAEAGPVEIRAPRLIDFVRERTASVSPTALESFLQCPFQYFGTKLIRLKTPPKRPEKRLDPLAQGGIVHMVLAEWWNRGGDIAAVFEEIFAREAERKRIPISYQTERARNMMLDGLRKFAAEPRRECQSRIEEKFEFALDESVAVNGKIDRLDIVDGRAVVIDYKYSSVERTKKRVKNENLLQAPLYLLAAERFFGLEPAAMFYVGVKGEIEYAEWKPEGDWAARAEERTLRIVDEIRGGRIEVAPADPDNCRFCDARDVCRYEAREAAATAEGA